MVFDADWKVWVFIVVFHSLPTNSEVAHKPHQHEKSTMENTQTHFFSHRTLSQRFKTTLFDWEVSGKENTHPDSVHLRLFVFFRKDTKGSRKNTNQCDWSLQKVSSKTDWTVKNSIPDMWNCGIQRDADEVLISCLFSWGFFPDVRRIRSTVRCKKTSA